MPTIKSYNKRKERMKSERSAFIPQYQELSDYHLAHRGRFLADDVNRGNTNHRRDTNQLNNTSRMSGRTLASGMMAGITSPARPWFRLGGGDPLLNEFAPVKQYLHDVEQIMYRVFATSNTYNSLHAIYGELGVFGISPMGVFKDFNNVIWCKPYTVGSYMIAADGKNVIDTFYREYSLTVGQMIKRFGKDNVSAAVLDQWKRGNTEAWRPIVHAIEPNDDRDMQSPMARDMLFRSVYYENSRSNGAADKFLRRSGFQEFPILVPRWEVTGEDIYATDCPGMIALGDTKALQLGERRGYQALDMLVQPKLQGPVEMQNSFNLHDDTIAWGNMSGGGIRSVYDFRPDLNAMDVKNDRTELRIKKAFYEDLFLMLSGSDRRQITAREVAEKQEEKLLMLGPVLERLHNELLDPLIDRTFNILQEAGVLPPPPPELAGRELNVEYVSVLAQAQRMVSIGGIEALTAFAGNLTAIWPEARHKVNSMQAIDNFADAMGTDPGIIRSDDEAGEISAAEAQAAQAQQMMELAAQGADVAKTASETEVNGESALDQTLQNAGLI